MLIKIAIVLFLIIIVYTLASSFIFMIKDKGDGDRAVRRLSWRIGLSLVLVLSLFAAAKLGWIEAGNKPPVRYPTQSSQDTE